jgi:hypothetical protein
VVTGWCLIVQDFSAEALLELIDCVKSYNGCNKVKFIGSKTTFDRLTEMGFNLGDIEYQEVISDEPQIFVLPINTDNT